MQDLFCSNQRGCFKVALERFRFISIAIVDMLYSKQFHYKELPRQLRFQLKSSHPVLTLGPISIIFQIFFVLYRSNKSHVSKPFQSDMCSEESVTDEALFREKTVCLWVGLFVHLGLASKWLIRSRSNLAGCKKDIKGVTWDYSWLSHFRFYDGTTPVTTLLPSKIDHCDIISVPRKY